MVLAPPTWLQLLLAAHAAGVSGVGPVPVAGGMPFPYNGPQPVHPLLHHVIQHLLAPQPFGFNAGKMEDRMDFGYRQKAV